MQHKLEEEENSGRERSILNVASSVVGPLFFEISNPFLVFAKMYLAHRKIVSDQVTRYPLLANKK